MLERRRNRRCGRSDFGWPVVHLTQCCGGQDSARRGTGIDSNHRAKVAKSGDAWKSSSRPSNTG
jgi:hypothetical protein